MPAPDQGVIERQYYLSVLGWAVDVPSLTLEDLRQRVLEAKTIKALDKNIRYEDPTQPLPSTLQAAGFGGSTAATDNGDGGVTLATSPSFKFPKFSYVEATFLKLANAAALSTTTPLADGIATAGTGITAARGDHVHPITGAFAYPIPADGSGLRAAPFGQKSSTNPIQNSGTKAPMVALPVPRPFTLTSISIFVAIAADAGSCKLAIYASDTRGLASGAPIWTSSAQSDTSQGVRDWTGLNVALSTPGTYWIVFASYGFTTTRGVPGRGNIDLDVRSPAINGNGNAAFLSNFNEAGGGAFPSSPNTSSSNDGTAFWMQFNGDPL